MTSSPTPQGADATPTFLDRLGRPLRDLRISVTDRCNFRCRYCMPRELFGADFAFLPRSEILSFEEIARQLGCSESYARRLTNKVKLAMEASL